MTALKASRVPVVLDTLVELAEQAAQAAPTGDPRNPWSVWDGPGRGDDLPLSYVVIGWTGQPDTQSVESELFNNGATVKREVIDVHCQASTASGNDGQQTTRNRVFAFLDQFAALVQGNRALGSRAALRVAGVEPFVGDGAGTTVMFTVHVEGDR